MKLQILIPHYHEDDATVKVLLDSIAMQRGIDFDDVGVIIVSDGDDVVLSTEALLAYPFKVAHVVIEHAGVSAARNTALSLSCAEYVMFCDADDAFYNSCGLWMIFQDIINGGFDYFVSDFVEECPYGPGGRMMYISHKEDYVFVHGKVYRRQFLEDNAIHWNEDLTVHEDSYFNLLCRELSNKTKVCHVPFYVWCWRGGSISRSSPLYMLQTYPQLLKSSASLIDELERRGMHEMAASAMMAMMLDTYYTMQRDEWIDSNNHELRNIALVALHKYFVNYEALWHEKSDAEKAIISQTCRERHIRDGMKLEQVTFDQWLHEMMSIKDTV